MKSFNKRLIAFKNKTEMNGKSLAKLFGCSEPSMSFYLNGKAGPRKARREKILNYMNNRLVLPATWNEVVPPSVLFEEKNDAVEEKPFKSPEKEVSVGVTFNTNTIASLLESASLYGTITITDISGVYTITKISKE